MSAEGGSSLSPVRLLEQLQSRLSNRLLTAALLLHLLCFSTPSLCPLRLLMALEPQRRSLKRSSKECWCSQCDDWDLHL